jgi:hypothetical protein
MATKARTLGILGGLAAITLTAAIGVLWPLPEKPSAASTQAEAHAKTHLVGSTSSAQRESRPAPPPVGIERAQTERRQRLVIEEKRRQLRDAFARRDAHPAADEHDRVPPMRAVPAAHGLEKDHIRGVVRELVPVMRDCYDSELEDDDAFEARVVTQFTILADEDIGGVVDEASVNFDESDFSSDDDEVRSRFSQCISESMYTMEFDPLEGQTEVRVTYPFVFSPA